ncbi:MAG: ABC transporter ATP-binding protein [Spirochaetaceae bacterium]|nr:ABC transporter ATP-binding protein [Spirochaetaceae bacterium]
MSKILEMSKLSKSFPLPLKKKLEILSDLDFSVESGLSVSITGKSGCGKSTLLQIAASLLKPTTGSVKIDNKEISNMSEKDLCNLRNKKLGFIFQNSLLLEDFSAIENIMMPLLINKVSKKNAEARAKELIELVDLSNRANHKIQQLSGGEKQRIAIARALANSPSIIFADEPTGSLDEKNAQFIEDLLLSLVKKEKTTLILVTHNNNFADKCDKKYILTFGKIEEPEKEELV